MQLASVDGAKINTAIAKAMLTVTISNISGGTFTINVNNVEAHNYGTLYYYVNDTLVYSGSESTFKVTELNGKQIEDNQTYEVKVLAEPFTIKVCTAEGDNVNSWLACIGNSKITKRGIGGQTLTAQLNKFATKVTGIRYNGYDDRPITITYFKI